MTSKSALDKESVCTEELLHADVHSTRQPVLSNRYYEGVVSDLLDQHCCMQRNGMSYLSRSGGITDICSRSELSGSMESLKRILFDVQQLAAEFHCRNQTGDSENSD
jgi:hypothetical protein